MTRRFIIALVALWAGTVAVAQNGTKEAAPTDADLDAAIRQIEQLETNAEFNKARLQAKRLEARLSGHPRLPAVRALSRRLVEEDEVATDLDFAVKQLADPSAAARRVAEKKLLAAGSTGRLLLHKVLRDQDPQLAPMAARLLATTGDESALPLLFARVAQNPTGAEAKALLPFIGRLLAHCTPAQLGQVYGWVKAAENSRFEVREAVALLGKVLRDRCAGDREKFNALLHDAGAYEFLKAYVQAACVAPDPALNEWAVTDGGAFSPMVPGLRGAYYHGKDFAKLACERLDEKIDIPERQFPYPDGRQDEISVRWTGFVVVKTPGKYTFYSASDDGQRVWVADKLIIDDWTDHGVQEVKGEIELTAGLHPYKVEFYQGGGGAAVTESWSGPGIERQVLGKDVLRTLPWPQMTVPVAAATTAAAAAPAATP